MATIINPTPIVAGTFGGMWIRNISVMLPTETHQGILSAELLPYDGAHLLATGSKRVAVNDLKTKRTTDAQLDAMLTAIVAEVKRQKNTTAEPRIISVQAPDPSKPVVATVQFVDKTNHIVRDCFALCGTDATFAQVFQSVMGGVAQLAGLSVA
jgi:hypothetical protein